MRRWNISALFFFILVPLIPLTLATSSFADDLVPAPWRSTDVGVVGLPGSARQGSDGDLFINGAGSDIWGTADSFHFVYQTLDDGQISSNPVAQDSTNPYAKVGLMIRLSLDPGSPHVILDRKPDGSLEFMTRSTQDGSTTFIAGGTFAGGLMLIRRNGVVTAVVCGDACHTIGSTPFPSGMALAGAVVTSHDPSTINHGYVAANMPTVSTVPAGWFSGDVGSVFISGDAFVENDVYTVRGAGADIWGTTDAYHIVQSVLNGDGEIIARVTSEQAADTYAKAGVIVTNGGGPTVILDIRPNGDIEFMARQRQGGQMAFLSGSTSSLPVWLKLQRTGDQFTGSMSSDGVNWQTVGTTAITMDPFINAGLAVTSHDTSALNVSTFDHVLVASQATMALDIGDVGVAGQEMFATNMYTMYGGGADIWGTAHAFAYLYQSLLNDGRMVVRINSLDDPNPFAKAGVMLRDSADASAAHVILDVRPSGNVEFMTRTSAGGSTTFLAGADVSFPVWLKLERNGHWTTGSISADGAAWTIVGTTDTDINSDALVGVAVTSHERAVLATATFDDIGR